MVDFFGVFFFRSGGVAEMREFVNMDFMFM